MKTITFDYTKASGAKSERTLLVMVQPTDKYAGIDMSEMDPTIAVLFADEMQKAHEEYVKVLNTIQRKYDVRYGYKQFLEDGMSNITEI